MDSLTFRFKGNGQDLVRSGLVEVPFDWDVEANLRHVGDEAAFPGHPVILALGGNDGATWRREFGLVPNSDPRPRAPWDQAFVLYPDPVSTDGDNQKWFSGVVGEGSYFAQPDDVGFLLEFLHRVRRMYQKRLDERHDARVAAGLNPTRYEVFDPDRIYLVGWSGGAAMTYRMLYEAPLVHPRDPSYVYRFDAAFLSAGSVGGYRNGHLQSDGVLRVDFSPETVGQNEPATVARSYPEPGSVTDTGVRIMHVQGAQDPRLPTQYAVFPTAAGTAAADAFRDDGTGQAGSAFVVASADKIDNFHAIAGMAEPDAREEARWDYTAEYGVERWAVYKGHDVWASSPFVAPGTSFGTVEETLVGAPWSPPTPAEVAAYGLPDRELIQFGVNDVVLLLVAGGMGHVWPSAPFRINRMALDFLEGVYPT